MKPSSSVLVWWLTWMIVTGVHCWGMRQFYGVAWWPLLTGAATVSFTAFRLSGAVIVAWSDREKWRLWAESERAKREASTDAEP